MINKLLFYCSLFLFVQKAFSQTPSIIPYPDDIQVSEGFFKFDSQTVCFFENGSAGWKQAILPLQKKLKITAGLDLKISQQSRQQNIIRVIKSNSLSVPEGYRLSVSKNTIIVEAHDEAGVFYAVQTILQMLPPEIESGKLARVS